MLWRTESLPPKCKSRAFACECGGTLRYNDGRYIAIERVTGQASGSTGLRMLDPGPDDIAALRAHIAELGFRLREAERACAAERQLTAYDLHDGLLQYVTAALLQIESIEARFVSNAQSRAALETAAALLHQAIAEGRGLLSGMLLPILDEQGLEGAIGNLVETCRAEGIAVDYQHELPPGRLDPLIERTVYRIAQESLGNVRRHSGAKRAQVMLRRDGDQLQLIVRDWGRGFDPAAIPEHRIGLAGIRKRAEVAAGHAEVDSAPGEGTTVSVELPLQASNRP